MSGISPKQPSTEKESLGQKPIRYKALSDQELEVDTIRHDHLGSELEKTETRSVEVPQKVGSPDHADKEKFEPAGIVGKALASVKGEKERIIPISIHDKWALPSFEDILLDRDLEVMDRVLEARKKVEEIKALYRELYPESFSTPMRAEVQALLKNGSMEKVKGGNSGVYLLRDAEGKPKFIIKPCDEGYLAINNGKKKASPFFNEDNVCAPCRGIGIYETAVQNAEISYEAAKLLKLEHVTPEVEVMILEHPLFHDIFDNTEEQNSRSAQKVESEMPTTREKVCSVQPYLEGYFDIGTYLATVASLSPKEYTNLEATNQEEYKRIRKELSPQDIDQHLYEDLALFIFITGEKDGNSGNIFSARTATEQGRQVYKIDNGATFPESNKGMLTGLGWIAHNYKAELSAHFKEKVQKLDESQIKELKTFMRTRGKSEDSIQALDARIKYLQKLCPECDTMKELDIAFDYIESET